MQRLRRFARYWDLVGNSGNFVALTPLIWQRGDAGATATEVSPFKNFLRFSDWLYAQIGRTDSIALVRLAQGLFEFLTGELKLEKKAVAETLWRDWQQAGRRDPPEFIREFILAEKVVRPRAPKNSLPKRQARHLVLGQNLTTNSH